MIKHLRLNLILLFIALAHLSMAQYKTPTHVLIKYKQETSIEEKAILINGTDGLKTFHPNNWLEKHEASISKIESGTFEKIEEALSKEENVGYIAPVYSPNGKHYITFSDELFVKLKNSSKLDELVKLARSNGAKMLGQTSFLENTYKLQVDKNSTGNAFELAAELNHQDFVSFAEANYIFTPSVTAFIPDDPMLNRQWALQNDGIPQQYNGLPGADMEVTSAWDITMGSPDITIAILDSGVDTLHEDLAENMVSGMGYDAVGLGFRGYPEPNYDGDGHGTCCAGIVAAVADNGIGIAGVAPKCKILPIRVFYYLVPEPGWDPYAWSESEWFADGIDYAWKNGADVASNSWGIPDAILDFIDPTRSGVALVDSVLAVAVRDGRDGKGTPFLFSSGNEGITDTIPLWPARTVNAIAVNSSSMCDEAKTKTSCDGEGWWAGNWGTGLEITAPGVKIPATDMTGSDGYRNGSYYTTFNGTSSACPNAAGVMALMLSANPGLSFAQAREVLSRTAEKVGGYDYSKEEKYGAWSYEMGYGRLNAFSAVTAAKQELTSTTQGENPYIYTQSNENYLHFYLAEESEVEVQIFDVMGNLVKSFPPTSGLRGNRNLLLNSNELKTGIYIARLSIDGSEEMVKFFAYRLGE